MINAVINMNKVIIQNVNLLFNVEKFSKKFANICVAFLIDFFSEYNKIILIEKLRDLFIFMTFLNLLRIIQLFQKTINLITQFIYIIIKIL